MEPNGKKDVVPEKEAAAKKPNLWKIALFALVPITALLVILVLVISLMPVFRLASVNGTYYASYDGEINREAYIKLYAGKWTGSDGSKGDYGILGDELLISGKDGSDTPFHYHATVKDGVLIIEGGEQNAVFVSDRHEHEYDGDWVTMEKVNDRWVVVEKVSNCTRGSAISAQFCFCGARKTHPISARVHVTYNQTVKTATCVESGEQVTHCQNCDWTETKIFAPTGRHSFSSNGNCTVCGAPQLTYELSEDGTHYTVTGFATGAEASRNVVILESYEGLPVTEVAPNTFYGLGRAMNFEIPASITKIGEGAFRGCDAYTTLRVATENPVYHSAYACLIETESKTLLCGYTTGTIPADGSVTKIAEYAFYRNEGLEFISIPATVTEIGASAFAGCVHLSGIAFDNTELKIAQNAFAGCVGLETIILTKNAAFLLSESTFVDCTKLKAINFYGTEAEWEKIKKDVYGFTRTMTIYCTNAMIVISQQ